MLTNRITIPEEDGNGNEDAEEAPEDIIATAMGDFFPNDTRNSHGIPGQSICYRSPRFGEVKLQIPIHPDVEEGRKLFAHYLWNAALLAADAIEVASWDGDGDVGNEEEGEERECHEGGIAWGGGAKVVGCAWMQLSGARRGYVSAVYQGDDSAMEGSSIYGFGMVDVDYIGTALPSLVAALSSAESVMITDHPSSPALTSDAIRINAERNLIRNEQARSDAVVTIAGYTWGTSTFYSPATYGTPLPSQPNPHSFDRIMLADCLWMVSQHVNLIKTILRYLKSSSDACALVMAGFHTGRDVVSNFFETATGEGYSQDEREEIDAEEAEVKGCLRTLELFEVSINGKRRAWQAKREGESREEAKKWCVCAVLAMR